MLAEKLGRTVEELERTISAAEFEAWKAYYTALDEARKILEDRAKSSGRR